MPAVAGRKGIVALKYFKPHLPQMYFLKRENFAGLLRFKLIVLSLLALTFTPLTLQPAFAQTAQTKVSLINKIKPAQLFLIGYPNGKNVTAEVKVSDVTDSDGLAAFAFKIGYDPTLVTVADSDGDGVADSSVVTPGTFLGSTGKQATCSQAYIDPTSSALKQLTFSCITLGPDPAAPKGSGSLATINFITQSKLATGNLTLNYTQLADNTENANLITHTASGIFIMIIKCADVSGPGGLPDGRVDLSNDILGISYRYQMTSGHPNWDQKYDLNNDGRIDLANDLLGAAYQYGVNCWQ